MTVAPWAPSIIVNSWSNQEIFEEHEDYWTVRDRETGIFGSGPTREAALEDFQRALRDHFNVLTRQAELSDDLAAQLVYLRQRLA
jgi:hypothetical protein